MVAKNVSAVLVESVVDMVRLILRRETKDKISGYISSGYETLDIDNRVLEDILRRGGFGEGCYDTTTLIGAEVLDSKD